MMAAEIPYTLVKLALPGDARSLNNLVILSERSKRRISWRQEAEAFRCRVKGVTGIRRHVRLADATNDGGSSITRFSEVEFRRRVAIPQEHAAIGFPSYFRSQRDRCQIGISVSTKRDRIDLTQSGRFYYPLASRVGYTGNAISVNAPFEMDGERLAPIDSAWNRWLSTEAATLLIELLTEDLFRLFGDAAASDDDRECGDFAPGRFAWKRGEFRLFDQPIPYRGARGIFNVPDELIAFLVPGGAGWSPRATLDYVSARWRGQ
jgi:hypothetical protein